jgi:EAL domain-containing protein (putative c-di-GMP-specific phosphodiesterase class I)
MTDSKDYYTFLNSLSSAVIVLTPVYDDTGSIADFCICYMNNPYVELSRGRVRNGQRVSTLEPQTQFNIDWFAVCVDIVTKNKQFTTSYYSPIEQKYFYMAARGAVPENENKFCILTLTDISAISPDGILPFCPNLQKHSFRHNLMQKRLQFAAEQKNFELNFQPQFIIQTKQLRGFEALLRWSDSILGHVNPDDFIPIAEQTHAISRIGYWTLEISVQTLKYWQEEYSFNGIMSVNVSPVQLQEPGFAAKLFELIEQYKIHPDRLELEITEGIFINNIEQTIQLLNKVRARGILISLDDFGTGYSSFRYLQSLPVTTIKIDKSFITGLDSIGGKEAVIADTVISLATRLGLETIAEGVEEEAQFAMLKTMGCTTVQGFLYGEPMDQRKCETLLIAQDV